MKTGATPCCRAAATASPSPVLSLREQLILEIRHPQVRALLILVDQPHAARVTLALFGQRLREHAEEAVDVGFAHEEIERQLHGAALNARQALRTAPLAAFSLERRAQRLDVRPAQVIACVARPRIVLHAPIMAHVFEAAPSVTRSTHASAKGRRSGSLERRGCVSRSRAISGCGTCPIVCAWREARCCETCEHPSTTQITPNASRVAPWRSPATRSASSPRSCSRRAPAPPPSRQRHRLRK